MSVVFTLTPFESLTTAQLYAIMALRSQVFVVEQQSIYLDADGNDLHALHICGWEDGQLVAYARLLPPGLKFEQASIGRIAVAPHARKDGLGNQLVTQALKHTGHYYPAAAIRIEAQAYLKSFYEKHGFAAHSEPYTLDGIPHIDMMMGA